MHGLVLGIVEARRFHVFLLHLILQHILNVDRFLIFDDFKLLDLALCFVLSFILLLPLIRDGYFNSRVLILILMR